MNISLLNKNWVKTEILKEITSCFENKNAIYPNMWDTIKAVLVVRFPTQNIYINKVKTRKTL